MGKTATEVLALWMERDLTAAARAGELLPAFHMDRVLYELGAVLDEGRCPVLAGPPGVGKTAAIEEAVRRAVAGEGPAILARHPVVQLSIRRGAASLKNRGELGAELQKLVFALGELDEPVIPYLRDLDAAFTFYVIPQIELLAYRLAVPVIAEGERKTLDMMFEDYPELHQRYVPVFVREPSFDRTADILTEWAAEQARRGGRVYTPEAQYEALQLAHRFLTRGHKPRNVLDLLRQSAIGADAGSVDADQVLARFCAHHEVPRVIVDPAMTLDLTQVERDFEASVLGQPEAIEAVVQVIGLLKAGLSDPRRPLGAFFFAGPTGVGKTHIARHLAGYLFGSEERMVRVNMADYQKPDDLLTLFGNPYGNSLPQIRGVLTTRLGGRPFAVLLLDEFEKAHESIHDAFLQLFDEGQFINGAGEAVSCRSLIVIATSNAGGDGVRTTPMGFDSEVDQERRQRIADQRLRERFRPELLNRFDRVVHFRPLGRGAIRAIAMRELAELERRPGVGRRGIGLDVDMSVLDWLVVNGYDPANGARFLRRTIERNVTSALASALVRTEAAPGDRFALTVRADRVVARRVGAASGSAAVRVAVERPLWSTTERLAVDGAVLDTQLAALRCGAAPLLARLAEERERRSELLEAMNAPGFWDGDARARDEVLARYRTLDAAVETQSRLAARIEQALEPGVAEGPVERAAGILERALAALHEWDMRLAAEGPGEALLIISCVDPRRPDGEWLEELAEIELRWCRHASLSARIVAYTESADELTMVALHAAGPGAAAVLAMEHGVHRRRSGAARTQKARVEVLPAPAPANASDPRIRDLKHRAGRFGLSLRVQGRLEIRDLGLAVDLLGQERDALAEVLNALGAAWAAGVPTLEVAREYGEDGLGTRDLRTGAAIVRAKDVAAGLLDPLVHAWRGHVRASEGEG
jgi:ATP-dependent Clp protease ATP-binding subunit ClpC